MRLISWLLSKLFSEKTLVDALKLKTDVFQVVVTTDQDFERLIDDLSEGRGGSYPVHIH